MSRFDELTKLFDPWRKKWLDQYREHQFLPPRIARHLQEFLGCPEAFNNADPHQPERIKYVSPTRAEWDDQQEKFILTAYDQFSSDLDFRDDGHFYFGLRIFLEHGPSIYPKEAFWFLLRAKFDGSRFLVEILRSKSRFDVGNSPNLKLDDLSASLFELLKEDLTKSPLISEKEPFKIGFIAHRDGET